MNITSFLANKCLEYLLNSNSSEEVSNTCSTQFNKHTSQNGPLTILPPPWAIEIEKFKSLCDGCGECISNCTNKILFFAKTNYPQIDFSRGFCNFCGKCAKNCPSGALHFNPLRPPWNIVASITENCLLNKNVLCSSCMEQCDNDAIVLPRSIYENLRPNILSSKCNGCGVCFRACPVGAIFFQEDKQLNPNK